jgi:RimJ/RimL family protein N-acetyltransferase
MSTFYQNKRIRIRPYEENDAAGMFECVSQSIKEMKAYLPWVHDRFSLQDCKNWIYNAQMIWPTGRQYDFVIEERGMAKRFLGGVGLLNVNPPYAILGYWLRTDFTGKGITTEACQLVFEFAKEVLGLEEITIYMSEGNAGSIAIANKLGAKYVETKKNHEFVDGQQLNCRFYRLSLKS